MTAGAIPAGEFNAVVRRFRDYLELPEYRQKTLEMNQYGRELAFAGITLRRDFARVWEPAHVAVHLDRLCSRGASVRSILDFGGGNSQLDYFLAHEGYHTKVLDIDAAVHASLSSGAERAGLQGKLSSFLYNGREHWPVADGSVDCLIAVSVIEGLTRWGRRLFWHEACRVLRPGGSLLLTFDYGEGARAVSDPLTSLADLRGLIGESGLTLAGKLPTVPSERELATDGAVKLSVSTRDGHDWRIVEYSFGAIELVKDWQEQSRAEPGFPRTRRVDDIPYTMTAELPDALRRFAPDRAGDILVTDPDRTFAWHVRHGPAATTVAPLAVADLRWEQFDSIAILSHDDMTGVLEGREDMWALHYQDRLELRGDTSLIMRVVGAWQEYLIS